MYLRGNLNKSMFVFFPCLSYCAFLRTGIQQYVPFSPTSSCFGGSITVLRKELSYRSRETRIAPYCIKQVQIKSFTVRYFLVFDINAEFHGQSLHMEINQLICTTNQLTGFHMRDCP